MKTSTLLSKVFRTPSRSRHRRGRGHINRIPALENLEARQMLTAIAWDGDNLQVSGSDSDDFIAVQEDELGVKLFTEDSVLTEYEGRSFDTAASIFVSGGEGNDVLMSYGTTLPVMLSGDGGNDILYSNSSNDSVEGGEGANWIHTEAIQGTGENAFGVTGLSLDSESLTVSAEFDSEGRIGLLVDVAGRSDIAGLAVDVHGMASISSVGVDVAVSGVIPEWGDAFGVQGVDLSNTNVTVRAGDSVNDGDGYQVELTSTLDVSGTDIGVAGVVSVQSEQTVVGFMGTVSNWDDAFGISGLDLEDSVLTGAAVLGADGHQEFTLDIDAGFDVAGTMINIGGSAVVTPSRTEIALEGAVANWDDAFGITGLDLNNSLVSVIASSDLTNGDDLHFEVAGDFQADDKTIGVAGRIDLAEEAIDAVFSGSVSDWDDAFGIDGMDLDAADLTIAASNRTDQGELRIDLNGDLDIHGKLAAVSGSLNVNDGRITGSLVGGVAADWQDAFGIEGLTLQETELSLEAVRDDETGDSLAFGLLSTLDLLGTNIDVAGDVVLAGGEVHGSLTGVVEGTWSAAFGIGALSLNDTILSVTGSKTSAGTVLTLGATAGMNVLGRDLNVTGTVDVTPEGVVSHLTSFVSGEWVDAFGVPGLNLKDTGVGVESTSESSGLSFDLDTNLNLFGNYVGVLGDLDLSPSGVDFTFSPPTSIDLPDLFGISGFSLDDVDLSISAGTDGLEVSLGSMMELGNIDIPFEGVFNVNRDDVSVSLTGEVAEWANAFEVPGLNLNDVALTLGAEKDALGASFYIGVGAAIELGSSEMRVAGLVGIGTTGWEVAFRGSIDSLQGDDVIDFANSLNQARDPETKAIPDGALGDIELRDAFINFAPYGGNEELGIEDGFGLGGAFYDDGKLLGSGEFIVDMAQGVFEVGLEIPELELGPVNLSDVIVDLRLAPTDSHYRVGGSASLMGAEVYLEGFVSSDQISLRGEAGINIEGLSASAEFIVDQNGVSFTASAALGFINEAKDLATRDLRTAANAAQALIDEAQDGVDAARRGVDQLEAELAEARAEAQETVDEVKADIAKAKSVVDSARSSMNYWSSQRSKRYKAWRSAVAKTKSVKWYQKPKYKAIEVAKYSSYAYSVTRHVAQTGVYKAADVAYKAVRNAAGWVLDAAGVEANPKVVGLKTLIAGANVGLGAAELVLDGVEKANQGILDALNLIDSIKVNRITIAGSVGKTGSGFLIAVDYSFDGRSQLISLDASPEDIAEEVAKKLMAAVL